MSVHPEQSNERRWTLNEDAGRIGISGPPLAQHESVEVIEVKPDQRIGASRCTCVAPSPVHYTDGDGHYLPITVGFWPRDHRAWRGTA